VKERLSGLRCSQCGTGESLTLDVVRGAVSCGECGATGHVASETETVSRWERPWPVDAVGTRRASEAKSAGDGRGHETEREERAQR
jgi:hypothetical protein